VVAEEVYFPALAYLGGAAPAGVESVRSSQLASQDTKLNMPESDRRSGISRWYRSCQKTPDTILRLWLGIGLPVSAGGARRLREALPRSMRHVARSASRVVTRRVL
jgi:hypothetical protein